MTENDKKEPEKATDAAKKPAEDQLVKTAKDIFKMIKEKAPIASEKLEVFQKNWLAMPSTRKKYEHWIDAPQIAIEEALGMTNDIIDHIQGQATPDQSLILKALKDKLHAPTAAAKSTATPTASAPATPVKAEAKPEAETPKAEKKPKAKTAKAKTAKKPAKGKK